MPDGASSERLSLHEPPSGMFDISLVFPATEDAVRQASQSIRQSLAALNLSDVTLGTVEIVLVEAANNIVEHAYANAGRGAIRLGCAFSDGLIRFELMDNGLPLPGLEMPPKQHHDLQAGLDSLPEGGFGWGLIRDMTTSLSYERCGSRNALRFTIAAQMDQR